MQKKTKLLIFALVLAVGVAVAVGVQTGAISSFIGGLRGPSVERAVDPPPAANAPGGVESPAEEDLGAFSEVDVQPQPGAGSGKANIVEDLPDEDPPKGK